MVFEALGATDELNSHIGVAREFCLASEAIAATDLPTKLLQIQSALMDVGSAVVRLALKKITSKNARLPP